MSSTWTEVPAFARGQSRGRAVSEGGSGSGPLPVRGTAPALAGVAAGVVGAVVFSVVATVDGLTRGDGYHPARHWISLLSRGPRGWVGTTNLAVAGLCFLAAGWGLAHLLAGRGGSRRVGPAVGALGGALLLAAAFPIDPVRSYPRGSAEVVTAAGAVHAVAGCLVIASLAAMAVAGRHLVRAAPWAARWTRASWACAAVVLASTATTGALTVAGADWEQARAGAFQRISLAAGLSWLVVASSVLLVGGFRSLLAGVGATGSAGGGHRAPASPGVGPVEASGGGPVCRLSPGLAGESPHDLELDPVGVVGVEGQGHAVVGLTDQRAQVQEGGPALDQGLEGVDLPGQVVEPRSTAAASA
jgi:Protein of unknown function (DUF998)